MRGANTDQEGRTGSLGNGVALHEICFTSGGAMETGDNLTGQSVLKCSSISDVLPVDCNICTVKVSESHFAN